VSGVRGRRLTAFLAAALLGLAAAGCGGGDDLAPEVPGEPADVVIPESAEAPAAAASNGDDAAADENADQDDADTGTTDDTGTTESTEPAPTDDTGTTTPDTSGGTTAPEGETDGPTNDTPPPEGSNAEQFEDFCAQNPGAC
jgi:hypothetical protein